MNKKEVAQITKAFIEKTIAEQEFLSHTVGEITYESAWEDLYSLFYEIKERIHNATKHAFDNYLVARAFLEYYEYKPSCVGKLCEDFVQNQGSCCQWDDLDKLSTSEILERARKLLRDGALDGLEEVKRSILIAIKIDISNDAL